MELLTLVTVSCVIICSSIESSEGRIHAWPIILLMGDSQTERSFDASAPWGSLIGDHFMRQADILVRGVSGVTSRGYISIFNEAVQDLDPESVAVAVLFVGTNDADPTMNVSLSEYMDNLKELVHTLSEYGVQRDKILLISPTPHYTHSCAPSWTMEITKSYADAAIQVSQQEGVSYTDIHTIILQQPNAEKMLTFDGIHLSVKGANLLFESIVPILDQKLVSYKKSQTHVRHFNVDYV